MASPFTVQPLPESGLRGRLSRGARGAEALVEINNLLAAAGSVREVSQEAVAEVLSRCGLEKPTPVQPGLEAFYERLYELSLVDHRLSAEEVADLLHLRAILRIAPRSIGRIHDAVSRRVYGKATAVVIRDNKVTREELEFLNRLQTTLRLRDA